MSYNKETRKLFTDNYNLTYPVRFEGYGLVDMTTNEPLTDQVYSEGPWIDVYTNGGPTVYGTIGTIGTRQANKPFTFVASVYYPVTNHQSTAIYNRDTADEIIDHLDSFMLTDGILIDSSTMIYSNQSQPKQVFAPRPDPDDNFTIVTCEYLYTYNYFPNS